MTEVVERFRELIRDYRLSETLLPHQHIVRARLEFIDGSVLVIQEAEFFDSGRRKYSYHWMNRAAQLLIRWDNAHDYPAVATSPHHQHVGSETNVQPSSPMTLEAVLRFIAAQLTSN